MFHHFRSHSLFSSLFSSLFTVSCFSTSNGSTILTILSICFTVIYFEIYSKNSAKFDSGDNLLLNARKICVFLKNNYIITNTQFNKFLLSILTVKQLKLQYRLFKLDFISFVDPLQNIFLMHFVLPQKCPYLELFWSAFFPSFPHLL